MDTRTGKLFNESDMSHEEFKKKLSEILSDDEKPNFVRVMRNITEKEKVAMQIKPYSPCGCGSGKKFKFCCKK